MILHLSTKSKLAAVGGWSLAPLIAFCQQYIFDDWQFFITLVLVIGIDTILGVWKHWRRRSISSYGFGRVVQKVCFYFLFLIATSALAHHKVHGAPNTLLGWLDSLAYSTILVREFLSILENSAAIGIYTPPAWLVQRLQQFHDHGPSTSAQKEKTDEHA